MSGRIVWFRNGEKTVGHRKTDRRQARTPLHLLPDHRLSFLLPDGISLPPGPVPGIMCLNIKGDLVEVTGKRRSFLTDQVLALFKARAPWWRGVIKAQIYRPSEPGPTISGPSRRGISGASGVIEIRINGIGRATETHGSAMRQLELI